MTARRPNRVPNAMPRIMHERGMSDGQVAAAVGIAQPRVNRIKNGWHQPGVHCALRFAAALGVTVEDIWGQR